MSLYENLKDFMDAQVDNGLGDSIRYEINGAPVEGAPGVFTVPGFIFDFADDGSGFGAVESGRQRWRMKIRKTSIPERPSLKHVVKSPKLDGSYRPASNSLIDGGDYWIADLQKAPA